MSLGERFLKILPLVLVIALIPALARWSTSLPKSTQPKAAPGQLPEADLRIEGGHFLEMEGERVIWKLDAAVAQLFEKKDRARLKEIKALFVRENGEKVTLRAREGQLQLSSRNLTVKGDVLVEDADGTRLQTQSLQWLDKEQRVVSDDWVRIVRDGMRVIGKGMQADVKLNNLLLRERVSTYLNDNVAGYGF